MIRVLARHVNDAEGYLIGDFAPGDINDLLDLLRRERVNLGGDAEDATFINPQEFEAPSPLQWVLTDEQRPRLVLEVIFE
jgi:hypothetical protein